MPQYSVELVFFPCDENVTFAVQGESAVDLTGIIISALEEDEEGEEEQRRRQGKRPSRSHISCVSIFSLKRHFDGYLAGHHS